MMSKEKEVAGKIIDAIVNDLSGRKGIGDEWEAIDEDIRLEIMEVWESIVIRNLPAEAEGAR